MELKDSYPQPQEIGGRLIRSVVDKFRAMGLDLPLGSHILIATSGGIDSMALALLLLKYGRRVAPRAQMSLLHVNHGWRAEESNQDEQFVREFAERWGVPCWVHRLTPVPSVQNPQSQHSWVPDAETPMNVRTEPLHSARDIAQGSLEENARTARKAIFESEAKKHGALVVTAHQADDMAETLLWRLFTGTTDTHGGGVMLRQGAECRPLLRVRKAELQAFLLEEGQSWREDSTNYAGRFLRSKMRQTLMPELERLFPKAVDHLVQLGLCAQSKNRTPSNASPKAPSKASSRTSLKDASPQGAALQAFDALFGAAGVRPRRGHWEAVRADESKNARWNLPGGWQLLKQERRWILEQSSERDGAPGDSID